MSFHFVQMVEDRWMSVAFVVTESINITQIIMEQEPVFHKSAFADFGVLFPHFTGKDVITSQEVSEAKNQIYEYYNLEGEELRLITYLAQIFPKGLIYDRIAKIMCLSDTSFLIGMIEALQLKGFIHISEMNHNQRLVKLSSDAVDAFKSYSPFGSLLEVELYDLLYYADPMTINSEKWLIHFRYELGAQQISSFGKNLTSLGAADLLDQELRVFCMALRHFIFHFTKPMAAENLLTGIHISEVIDSNWDSAKVSLDALVHKGLLITQDDGYIIAPKVADVLFHGHDEIVNYDDISQRVQIIKSSDIKKKELFFSPQSQKEIEHLRYMLSLDGFERASSILERKKRNPAIQSLFWGEPGTGKTETVKQIALETGRDLFLFDVAKVTAKEWGATENLYRKLFLSYRYITAVKSLTPILFINEADQILSRRLSELEYSMDKAENTVSNILLQEIEDMHGILLATTNNANILDEAFDRRFLFKTELQKPDATARKHIWMSMIPELTDEDAEFLATKYTMSGAQISNVATKRDLAELYYEGDRGLLYITSLCEKEMNTGFSHSKVMRIGY